MKYSVSISVYEVQEQPAESTIATQGLVGAPYYAPDSFSINKSIEAESVADAVNKIAASFPQV